jgi:hypothetical protein
MALRNFWTMPWSTAAGGILGVLTVLATPNLVGPLRDAYDTAFPVVRMSGKLVQRDGDAVVLHISGNKLRGEECRLLAVYGYAVDAKGLLYDAVATRIDAPATNRMREAGSYDIGLWRVQPVVPGAVGVRVVAQHDCVGRVILSTIAEASLHEDTAKP